jgi:hypothetical protein
MLSVVMGTQSVKCRMLIAQVLATTAGLSGSCAVASLEAAAAASSVALLLQGSSAELLQANASV